MNTNLLRHRPTLFIARDPKAQTQGFTLIECLVAIVMVAIVASAIAPAMVLSVATRVHSQKSEQALALAQSEIDSTRVFVERGGDYDVAALPPLAAGVADKDIKTALGPDRSISDDTNFAYAEGRDVNGDGETDFFVQRYRATGQVVDDDGRPVAFAMGVRVYDRNVAGDGNLSTETVSLVMTSGDGGRATRPLAVLYSTIATSDRGDSLCSLNTYYKPSALPGQTGDLPTTGRLPDICQ
jgi:prepilin-type N-terminal cleavage/methylation domain-containing protein